MLKQLLFAALARRSYVNQLVAKPVWPKVVRSEGSKRLVSCLSTFTTYNKQTTKHIITTGGGFNALFLPTKHRKKPKIWDERGKKEFFWFEILWMKIGDFFSISIWRFLRALFFHFLLQSIEEGMRRLERMTIQRLDVRYDMNQKGKKLPLLLAMTSIFLPYSISFKASFGFTWVISSISIFPCRQT